MCGMGFWPVVRHVVQNSDIVVLIVDARMPRLSRNEELERAVLRYRKQLVTVFNKIDLIPQKELLHLRELYPEAFFVSGNKNIGLKKLKEGLFIIAKRYTDSEPKIGVVGYPNVGKSSVINALAKRARAKVSNVAGTTKGVQWIRAGGLLVSDTPGVIPIDDSAITLGMWGAKNPEKLKFPEIAAYALIAHLRRTRSLRSLETAYNIRFSASDSETVLQELGKKRGFLKKGGIIDERRTAIQLLREWQKGVIRIHSTTGP